MNRLVALALLLVAPAAADGNFNFYLNLGVGSAQAENSPAWLGYTGTTEPAYRGFPDGRNAFQWTAAVQGQWARGPWHFAVGLDSAESGIDPTHEGTPRLGQALARRQLGSEWSLSVGRFPVPYGRNEGRWARRHEGFATESVLARGIDFFDIADGLALRQDGTAVVLDIWAGHGELESAYGTSEGVVRSAVPLWGGGAALSVNCRNLTVELGAILAELNDRARQPWVDLLAAGEIALGDGTVRLTGRYSLREDWPIPGVGQIERERLTGALEASYQVARRVSIHGRIEATEDRQKTTAAGPGDVVLLELPRTYANAGLAVAFDPHDHLRVRLEAHFGRDQYISSRGPSVVELTPKGWGIGFPREDLDVARQRALVLSASITW